MSMNIDDKGSCPFSMPFPKYEIPLSSLKKTNTKTKNNLFNIWKNNTVSINLQKSTLERNYPANKYNIQFINCTQEEKHF